ncbi:MAG: hypothetical protein ABIP48_22515 [Planctomycetota bacterium]
MFQPVIVVEKLSKQYRIGRRGTHADELRGVLAGAITAPFRKLFGRDGQPLPGPPLASAGDRCDEEEGVVGILKRRRTKFGDLLTRTI